MVNSYLETKGDRIACDQTDAAGVLKKRPARPAATVHPTWALRGQLARASVWLLLVEGSIWGKQVPREQSWTIQIGNAQRIQTMESIVSGWEGNEAGLIRGLINRKSSPETGTVAYVTDKLSSLHEFSKIRGCG